MVTPRSASPAATPDCQPLDKTAAASARQYAADQRARVDVLASVLEDIAENGYPSPESGVLWEVAPGPPLTVGTALELLRDSSAVNSWNVPGRWRYIATPDDPGSPRWLLGEGVRTIRGPLVRFRFHHRSPTRRRHARLRRAGLGHHAAGIHRRPRPPRAAEGEDLGRPVQLPRAGTTAPTAP